MKHITVLKEEAVALLALTKDSVVIDATHGAGGHALEICSQLSSRGVYIGIDADATALASSPLTTSTVKPAYHLVHANFSELEEVIRSLHITEADAILADLGWRTDQFTDGGKGFSFMNDEPLSMTYGDPSEYLFTAHDIVNSWAEEDIANVIYAYGEERASRKIAKAIVMARKAAPIMTALELATVIEGVMPRSKSVKIHPATKTFQALRIAVNDELKKLETFIAQATKILAPEGVLAIISFHSLEDRVIKHAFRELKQTGDFELLTKKPITASFVELRENPRSRSAKLRGIKKLSQDN
jgi:16S rRNA (cytosine1402-N4)-methyltransferase